MREDAAFFFATVYLVWFHTRLVWVTQHARGQTQFSVKELAIAKTVSIFELLQIILKTCKNLNNPAQFPTQLKF